MTGMELPPAPDAASTPSRLCGRCSTVTNTAGDFCPHCGGPYLVKPRRPPSKRVVVLLCIVLLILVGAAGGFALKVRHDDHARAQRAAAKAAAVKQAALDAATAKQAADDAERAKRADLVTQLEASITKDANRSIAAGLLDSPKVTATSCTPLGGGSTDDLTALTGTFSCIAVYKNNSDGTQEGYRFAGAINYNDETYTWHLGA